MLERKDLQIIAEIIEAKTKVLDLGCGNGELLCELTNYKSISGLGIEISLERIKKCLEKGISVVQEDLNEGLKTFQDKSFDYVILSQTLEYISNPIYLIKEMLRVGDKCIISFENLAYWKNRLSFLFHGSIEKRNSSECFLHNDQQQQLLTTRKFISLCSHHELNICNVFHHPKRRFNLARNYPNLFSKVSIFILEGS